jgi:hypothetical protein
MRKFSLFFSGHISLEKIKIKALQTERQIWEGRGSKNEGGAKSDLRLQ